MNTNINAYIGNKIKELRKKRNITQEELGDYLNTTSQTISRYENGKLKTNYDILFKLSEYFKTSINSFFPPIDSNTYNILGDRMYEEGITISQLSIITNIDCEVIKRIYNGEEKLPKPSILIKIANALNDEPFYYLSASGYVDDEMLNDYDLYETGIRYLLPENERKYLCVYICQYWNSKTKNHIYSYEEIYNTIFDDEKKIFTPSDVKRIIQNPVSNNLKQQEITQFINGINKKIQTKDIIDISELDDHDKKQIRYMIDLMKNNKNKEK